MSATQKITTKRAYKKAPLVIRTFLDKDSKNLIMRFTKNHPKKIKINDIKRAKELKKIDKDKAKKARIEEKKMKHQNAKEKFELLTIDEKRFLVEEANEGLLNLSSFTKAQKIHITDYLIQNTKNSVFVDMIKSGKLDNMKQKVIKKTRKSKDKETSLNLTTLGDNPKGMSMMMGNEKLVNPQDVEGDEYEVIRFNE